MAISNEDIEELRNYFVSKTESGNVLPNPKSVIDGTLFYLKVADGVKEEHIMFEGRWHKKVTDSNSNLTLEEI